MLALNLTPQNKALLLEKIMKFIQGSERKYINSLANLTEELKHSFGNFTFEEWLDFFDTLDHTRLVAFSAAHLNNKGSSLITFISLFPLMCRITSQDSTMRPVDYLLFGFFILNIIGQFNYKPLLEIHRKAQYLRQEEIGLACGISWSVFMACIFSSKLSDFRLLAAGLALFFSFKYKTFDPNVIPKTALACFDQRFLVGAVSVVSFFKELKNQVENGIFLAPQR